MQARTRKYAIPKTTASAPNTAGVASATTNNGGRCGEDRQSNGAFLGIDGVRQPGVRPPRPPQSGKQKRPAQQSFPGLVGCEEAGDQGDGEDEVEEQL